jgi:hypothetical protein
MQCRSTSINDNVVQDDTDTKQLAVDDAEPAEMFRIPVPTVHTTTTTKKCGPSVVRKKRGRVRIRLAGGRDLDLAG